MMRIDIVIKVVLSILMFLCLLDMPYGFYQLVRFVSLVGFGILAYKSNENGDNVEAIIYVGLALMFQPFFKLSLGREVWNVVDVVVGVGLLLTLLKKRNEAE